MAPDELAVLLAARCQHATAELPPGEPTAVKELVAVMKNGFAAEPPVILREVMNVDIESPETVIKALLIMNQRVLQYEESIK